MSLVVKFNKRFLLNCLNSFKKSYHVLLLTLFSATSLLCITTTPSSSDSEILTLPTSAFASLKGNSKNLACFGSLVTLPSASPIVTPGNLPLIFENNSSAIISIFCIMYLSIVATYEDWHWRFVILIFVCLIKGIVDPRIPIFKYSHHSNSK